MAPGRSMSSPGRPDVVVIAGPTAGGKSALALEIARRLDGVVVNADSMQVYAELSILTARPTPAETGEIEHVLYGHVPAARAYSVAEWLNDAAAALDAIARRGKVAVFAGGTGLYFKALEEGLSPIPPIDPGVRERWRAAAREAPERLAGELAARDPVAAASLKGGDPQRLTRALEVFETTGKSIVDWQREGRNTSLIGERSAEKWLVMPDRAELHRRIDRRVDEMMAGGALEEVRQLMARRLSPQLPAMRAIGVPQLAAHLEGEIELPTAVERVKAASRQYAKRQTTWFRHQTGLDWRNWPVQGAGAV